MYSAQKYVKRVLGGRTEDWSMKPYLNIADLSVHTKPDARQTGVSRSDGNGVHDASKAHFNQINSVLKGFQEGGVLL